MSEGGPAHPAGPARRDRATGRARLPRGALLGWAAVAVVLVTAWGVTTAVAADEDPPDAQVERGGEVYAIYCATCHGTEGGGREGTGEQAGPSLLETDVAYNDLLVRTGRMPIVSTEAGILEEPDLDDADREALVAWLAEDLGLEGEIPPPPGEGDPARGGDLYAANCMQCHGATGVGGIAGAGETVRGVRDLDAVAIVEAIRVGPFTMPRFSEEQLDEQDVADIASYTAQMTEQPMSPTGLRELDRVSQALAVIPILVLVALVVSLANRRKRG